MQSSLLEKNPVYRPAGAELKVTLNKTPCRPSTCKPLLPRPRARSCGKSRPKHRPTQSPKQPLPLWSPLRLTKPRRRPPRSSRVRSLARLIGTTSSGDCIRCRRNSLPLWNLNPSHRSASFHSLPLSLSLSLSLSLEPQRAALPASSLRS